MTAGGGGAGAGVGAAAGDGASDTAPAANPTDGTPPKEPTKPSRPQPRTRHAFIGYISDSDEDDFERPPPRGSQRSTRGAAAATGVRAPSPLTLVYDAAMQSEEGASATAAAAAANTDKGNGAESSPSSHDDVALLADLEALNQLLEAS